MINYKFLSIALIGLLAASCSVKENPDDCLVPVSVHLNNFTTTQEEMPDTKTDPVNIADYTGIKAVTLAFYSGSTETYKVTQFKSDPTTFTTFGDFSLSLPMGSYTMVVLGYGLNANEPAITLTSPTAATFGDNPARETFTATQTVNIHNTDAVDISATLNRVISKLKIASSDVRTSNVASVRMTFSAGGKAFNPTTGLASTNTGFNNIVNISSKVGTTSGSFSYLFLTADEQTMNVTVETLDEDGNTLFRKVISDVPFKRNRCTVLTGAIYTNSATGGSFQLNTDWINEHDLDF